MKNNEINENVIEVLMFLFENSQKQDNFLSLPRKEIESILDRVGFTENEIKLSLSWLDDLLKLCDQVDDKVLVQVPKNRMISPYEQQSLSVKCQGYLLELEQQGVLDDLTRELVIDRALALSNAPLTVEELHWVVQMVLFNLPQYNHELIMVEQERLTPLWH